VDGQPKPEPGQEPVAIPNVVSSGYFRAMQIPIMQGRDFNAEDTTGKPDAVIVNSLLADHFFPGQDPIGKSIRIRYTGEKPCAIVGVVPYVFDRAPGLYGILSYFVGQTSREIGIRMTVGANAVDIVKLVAKQGLRPVTVGLTTGILAGLLLARFIQTLLYRVSAYDPMTSLLTILVLGIATLLACLLPALRAIQINPTGVLNE
jgi:MacB-like periplasmic core domain/FtsX-like permease family